MAGSDGAALDAATLAPLAEALKGECQVHESEHSNFKDGVYGEEWLTQQFGLETPSLPPHWQP